MIAQDFQAKLDAIVSDLQTKGKGQTVNIMFRNPNNSPNALPLSSDVNGVVNAGQLAAVQAFLNPIMTVADDYDAFSAPLKATSEAFKTAQLPHQALIDAAAASRNALSAALEADPAYQGAKTALDNARLDQSYVDARSDYIGQNVSENYAELTQAKGAYVY